MSEIKINELNTETELTDTHLFITQNGDSETKTTSFELIKRTLSGIGGTKFLVSDIEPTENISENDIWLSSATDTNGDIYEYDGSSWVYKTNINGTTEVVSNAVVYTATLYTSDWDTTTLPYKQEVALEGISENSSPILDLIVSDDVSVGITEINEWLNVSKAIAESNKISFYCYQKIPTIDLNFKVKVV